jgi:hypothetical protein
MRINFVHDAVGTRVESDEGDLTYIHRNGLSMKDFEEVLRCILAMFVSEVQFSSQVALEDPKCTSRS